MKTKLEAVERKIRELCSELLNLNNGCWVHDFSENRKGYICGKSPKTGHFYVKWENCSSPQRASITSSEEIIGHDITWEHIAKAFCELQIHVELMLYGKLHIGHYDENKYYTKCYWNLGLPLHQQKTEVWEFLYQIFKLNEDE